MHIRNQITSLVNQAIADAGFEYNGEIVLEYPAELSMGDFATPVAMKLGKQLGQNPREVAQAVAEHLGAKHPSEIERVEVAGPGYINFTLSADFWANLKQEILQAGEDWGKNNSLEGQKYLMEHTSVNLFKPFHIGHLLSNVTGESLTRISAANGAETTAISYPSDKSPGIAKAVWGLWELHGEEVYTKLATDDVREALGYIGEAYSYATAEYKVRPELEPIIKQITKDIYEKVNSFQDVNYYGIYEQGKNLSLQYFQEFAKQMGSNFSGYIFESQAEEKGKEVIAQHMNIYTESEGAIIFEGSKPEYGLFDSVFVNSAGFATYLGKDVGLMALKAEQYGDYDKWFYVTDNEQKPHFQLMSKSVEQFQSDWIEKAVFVHHGRLSLSTGKISSRSGDVPMAEELLDKVKDASYAKVIDREVEQAQALDIADKIAQSALKYAVLRVQTGKNMVIDLEKDLSFEGTSGPYIQYAYVRATSALADARTLLSGDESAIRIGRTPELERLLVRYGDAVERALEDYSPHHIAHYAYNLAQEFNSFYAQTKIADANNPDILANIHLAEAVAQTLHNALYLLGIETVEEM